MNTASLADLRALNAEITLVGAGPIGLNMAVALADRGFRVLLLESGGEAADAQRQDLSADHVLTPDHHYAAHITTARRLGGAGGLWGGRCVPCDDIDFQPRPWLGLEGWPIQKDDLDPTLEEACSLLGAGAPVFSAPAPGVQTTSDRFQVDRLERWVNQPRAHVKHRDRLAEDDRITLALNITVTGVELSQTEPGQTEPSQIAALNLHFHTSQTTGQTSEQTTAQLPVSRVILTGGGNASTRLLLNVQDQHPDLFGGADGALGKYYMGHVNGQIADITFDTPALHDALTYHVDAHGSYVRRRITPSDACQQEAGLANVAFWPVVPEIAKPAHRSGPLSSVFLGLTLPGIGKRIIAEPIRLRHCGPGPYARLPHLLNILRDPLRTLSFAPWFIYHRYFAKHRIPGFFLTNPARRYGLEFHSEHLPDAASQMRLSSERDATGMRRLEIEFRYSDKDVASVLKAHDEIETWLRAEGLGRLHYRYDAADRADGVLKEAIHGNHQEGTIRMGTDPKEAVVNAMAQSFDLANLYVVSTAILPTSSQANPTLTALQIGLRLADHLKECCHA
nr:GMC oxidoreductase [Epibacterium ulvae]